MKAASRVASREERRVVLLAATTVESKVGRSVDAMVVHWVDVSAVARVASMGASMVGQKVGVMAHVKADRLVYLLDD